MSNAVGTRSLDPLDRLVLRRVVTEGGCWVWPGSKNGKGYGQIRVGGKVRYTHRTDYELLVGPIPVGLVLDHLCRNRACFNPAHLEPVTAAVNIMRGAGNSAVNATKTHCPQGHSLADAYVCSGHRRGRVCHDARTAKRYRERRRTERRNTR